MKINDKEVDLDEIIKKQGEVNTLDTIYANDYLRKLKMTCQEWSAFTNTPIDSFSMSDVYGKEEKEKFWSKKISYDFFCKFVVTAKAGLGERVESLLKYKMSQKAYLENMKENFPDEYSRKRTEGPASEEDILNLKEISRQWNDVKIRIDPYGEIERSNLEVLFTITHPTISTIEDGTHIELINEKLQSLQHASDIFKECVKTDYEYDSIQTKIQETVKSAIEKYKVLFEKTASEIIEHYDLSAIIKKAYLENEAAKEKWGKSYQNDKLLEDSFEIDNNGNIKILDEEGAKKLIVEKGDNRTYCTDKIFENETEMIKEVYRFFKEYHRGLRYFSSNEADKYYRFKDTIMGKMTKGAIINWGENNENGEWFAPTEEQAEAMISEGGLKLGETTIDYSSSDKATNGKTYGSEIAAINGLVELIARFEQLKDDEKIALTEQIKTEVYNKSKLSPNLATRIQSSMEDKGIETSIIEVLGTIHDNWVKDNGNKFDAPDRAKKLHQFVDLRLMSYGGDGATADLLFLQPILEGAGIEVDVQEKLKSEFERQQKEYMESHGIADSKGLREYLSNISENYPTIKGVTTTKGQKDNTEKGIKVPRYIIADELQKSEILERMTEQISTKIGVHYEREVSVDEIEEVAKEVTFENAKNAMNAVTTSKDEQLIENNGQSHEDE